MNLDVWKLSKDGSIVSSDTKTSFGTMEVTTVDNNGGYECLKEGTGLTQNQDLLNRVQNNIRERFSLEGAEPDNDDDDY